MLQELLEPIGCGRGDEEVRCECGPRMHSKGIRPKTVLTILGPIRFSRSMFQCPVCGKTHFPGDEIIDVSGTSRSPGLRRMMARAGSSSTFKQGAQDLKIYADIQVSPKDVERVAEGIGEEVEAWSKQEAEGLLNENRPVPLRKEISVLYVSYDGTGVPMTKKEVAGRKGKQVDGSAKTREVKLGCVFTQTTTNKEGYAVRDPDSTSFVGNIESADEFGYRIYAEAVRRGLESAREVVILGDGAEWIRGIAEMHFHGATQIVDLYHAREHVSKLGKLLFGADEKMNLRFRKQWWKILDSGKVEKLISQARKHPPQNPEIAKKVETELNYLEKNKERMRYADFRKRGLFIGSGVIEAGCKNVIGKRLKQSGMEWSVRGANSIIALRCSTLSNRIDDFWDARAA